MAKFRDLASYSGANGYKLLPFRFSPLDDENYVLSNFVGEHIILQKQGLQDLVNHQLESTSELYQDLQSKHFLFDDDSGVAMELLPLKLRTKLSSLSNFTSLHLFVVSLRCEHSCPYCQVSRQSDDRIAYDMSEATADRSLDLVFAGPSPSIKIEFQGGEPLLNFPLVKYVVTEAKRRNEVHRRTLSFVIATNLAVLTDHILDFCALHGIHISTSLDGPMDLHNANRPRPGHDSYQRTIEGILRAREALGVDKVSALMTTTGRSLGRVTEIIDEYLKHRFEGIFLRPLSPYGFAVKTKVITAYDTEQWLKFYFDGLDYILDLNRAGIRFREFYATTILRKMLTPFSTGYVDLMSPSGAGIAAVVYNYNGDIYASDESRMLAEMGDHTFRLGNVHTDTFQSVFTNEVLLDTLERSFAASSPMCSDCAFEPYCGADPVYHHATQKDVVGHKMDSGFCRRNMAIMKKLVSLLSDQKMRPILEGWVR